ncbi:hypothetical protein [Rubritalea sp.]
MRILDLLINFSNLHYTIAQKFGIAENDFNNTNSRTIVELG